LGEKGPFHDAVIRVYDEAGNVIKTHGYAGEFDRTLKTRVGGHDSSYLPWTPELRAIINFA
jgi:hypothetical protein